MVKISQWFHNKQTFVREQESKSFPWPENIYNINWNLYFSFIILLNWLIIQAGIMTAFRLSGQDLKAGFSKMYYYLHSPDLYFLQ